MDYLSSRRTAARPAASSSPNQSTPATVCSQGSEIEEGEAPAETSLAPAMPAQGESTPPDAAVLHMVWDEREGNQVTPPTPQGQLWGKRQAPGATPYTSY